MNTHINQPPQAQPSRGYQITVRKTGLVVRLDPNLSHAQARALVDAVVGGSVLIARRVDVETAVAAIGDFRACGSVIGLKNCF